jgi:hypothetical protein
MLPLHSSALRAILSHLFDRWCNTLPTPCLAIHQQPRIANSTKYKPAEMAQILPH